MTQYTKRDHYWPFWYQGDEIIKIRKFCEEIGVLEFVEAIEVSEAA